MKKIDEATKFQMEMGVRPTRGYARYSNDADKKKALEANQNIMYRNAAVLKSLFEQAGFGVTIGGDNILHFSLILKLGKVEYPLGLKWGSTYLRITNGFRGNRKMQLVYDKPIDKKKVDKVVEVFYNYFKGLQTQESEKIQRTKLIESVVDEAKPLMELLSKKLKGTSTPDGVSSVFTRPDKLKYRFDDRELVLVYTAQRSKWTLSKEIVDMPVLEITFNLGAYLDLCSINITDPTLCNPKDHMRSFDNISDFYKQGHGMAECLENISSDVRNILKKDPVGKKFVEVFTEVRNKYA